MNRRLTLLAFSALALLASVFGRHSIAEAQSHPHTWYFLNIYAIVDTGSAYAHRIDGLQKCAVGGETQYGSTYESHNFQFTWYSYNQYTSSQHEYKREYRCTACGHVKVTSELQGHECESIYDTQCRLCGYTHVRMCG